MNIQNNNVESNDMSKKKQRPPSGYTPEQIKEIQNFFKNNDFTAMIAVDHKPDFSGNKAELYKKSKYIF